MTIKIRRKPHAADLSSLRYRVTPFKAIGIYPRGVFRSPTAAFLADDEITFAVTHCSTWRNHKNLPYSEVNWMNPELVRLLGSFIFCEKFTDRRCLFYPHVYEDMQLVNANLDLTQEDCILEVKRAVLNEAIFSRPNLVPEPSTQHSQMGYLFAASDLDIPLRDTYWGLISTSNLLLMRGIQALIKCDMLSRHPEFQEEAAIAAFIALDASFEMVRRHLQERGISNPSAADAAKWFHDTFDGPLGFEQPEDGHFFGEFYTQRIQTLHPGSRFGDSPFAALAIDDRIHLRQALPGLFAYLVSGAHSPSWLEWVSDAQGK
jgi:hypothetical protein